MKRYLILQFITLVMVSLLLSGCSDMNRQTGDETTVQNSAKPVFQVDVSDPTSDKPQSKLWYMEEHWWAMMPTTSGPSLWKRGDEGWIEYKDAVNSLQGIPGRADVWAEEGQVTAVSVGSQSLTVFRLEKRTTEPKWRAVVLDTLYPPSKDDGIETATIVRDETGRWFVAADAGDNICVWSSDGETGIWTNPVVLAKGIDEDDISLITEIPEGVGVIWSNQKEETVQMRTHKNGDSVELWSDTITIEAGNKTADDHLNAALSSDGTLWLATKNSVDIESKPQFVLRVRTPDREWRNFPYADLHPVKLPSRPIVIAVEESSIVLGAHSIYDQQNPYLGEIVSGIVDTSHAEILENISSIMFPDTTNWTGVNRINNVTGPKQPFRKDAPWIVLASDKDGNIYEADLSKQINK